MSWRSMAVMKRGVLLACLLASLASAADECHKHRTDEKKCDAALSCVWAEFEGGKGFCARVSKKEDLKALKGLDLAGRVSLPDQEIDSAKCRRLGTAKFQGLFGAGYISRPKCVQASGCCYCMPKDKNHRGIQCVDTAEKNLLHQKQSHACDCDPLHLNGGKALSYNAEHVRVSYNMVGTSPIKASGKKTTFLTTEGSEAEFIGLWQFDPKPTDSAANPKSQSPSTDVPGFTEDEQTDTALKTLISSGLVRKHTESGMLKLDIKPEILSNEKEGLDKGKQFELRVCKVKVLAKNALEKRKYRVFGCRTACGQTVGDIAGETVSEGTRCLKTQLLKTAGCSREAVESFQKLYTSYMSAGDQLVADSQIALTEFNKMTSPDKLAFVKDQEGFEETWTAEKISIAAIDKFKEDMSDAAAFALYVGNRKCIPVQHAQGSGSDACPKGDDDDKMGLLDMGKKLQAFLTQCPLPKHMSPDSSHAREINTQGSLGDDTAVRIMRMTESLVSLTDPKKVRLTEEGKKKMESFTPGEMPLDETVILKNRVLPEDDDGDSPDVVSELVTASIIQSENDNADLGPARKSSSSEPSTFLQMALLQVAELEGASSSTKMLAKGWWSSMFAKIGAKAEQVYKEKLAAVTQCAKNVLKKVKDGFNTVKDGVNAVKGAAKTAFNAVKDKAIKVATRAARAAYCAARHPLDAVKKTWQWVKKNKYALMKAAIGISCFAATVATAGAAAPACMAIAVASKSMLTIMEQCIPNAKNGGITAPPSKPSGDGVVAKGITKMPDTCGWNTVYTVVTDAVVTVGTSFIPGADVIGEGAETTLRIGAGVLGGILKEGNKVVKCIKTAPLKGCIASAAVAVAVSAVSAAVDEFLGDSHDVFNQDAVNDDFLGVSGYLAKLGTAGAKKYLECVDKPSEEGKKIARKDKFLACVKDLPKSLMKDEVMGMITQSKIGSKIGHDLKAKASAIAAPVIEVKNAVAGVTAPLAAAVTKSASAVANAQKAVASVTASGAAAISDISTLGGAGQILNTPTTDPPGTPTEYDDCVLETTVPEEFAPETESADAVKKGASDVASAQNAAASAVAPLKDAVKKGASDVASAPKIKRAKKVNAGYSGFATEMYFEWRRYGANQLRCRRITKRVYYQNFDVYPESWLPISERPEGMSGHAFTYIDLDGQEFNIDETIAGVYKHPDTTYSYDTYFYMYEKRKVDPNANVNEMFSCDRQLMDRRTWIKVDMSNGCK